MTPRTLVAPLVAVVIGVALMATGTSGAADGRTAPDGAEAVREDGGDRPSPSRLVHTYSIVARDPKTGEMGVAVQSHWFSVGSIVAWAEAGVGAVATQSFVQPSYGRDGLALMAQGTAAPEALRRLVDADPQEEVRQVALVDARGHVAAHTGRLCIPAAGHHVGEGYSVQANLMLDDGVWPAMARAFENSRGDLAERMLTALEAAQAAGGDIRGRQSAALLVVRAEPTGDSWTDRIFDLRVEDHAEPLLELRRLVGLARAYRLMNEGDEHVAANRHDKALAAYARAARLAPDNDEFIFWKGVTLVSMDRLQQALPAFRKAFLMNPSWSLLVPRLVQVGLLPDDPEILAAIREQEPRPGNDPVKP